MRRSLVLCLTLLLTMFAGCSGEKVAAAKGMVYVCGCGDDCTDCDTVATAAGKCACGKELAAHHVLSLTGTTAKVCSCTDDCSCEPSADEAGKCSCGKPIKDVSLAGKGFFTCSCEDDCSCTPVASGPGKCGCGKDLVAIK